MNPLKWEHTCYELSNFKSCCKLQYKVKVAGISYNLIFKLKKIVINSFSIIIICKIISMSKQNK